MDSEKQSAAHQENVNTLKSTFDELQHRHSKQETLTEELRKKRDDMRETLADSESARSQLASSERDLERQIGQYVKAELIMCDQIAQLTTVNDQLQQERQTEQASARQLMTDQHAMVERLGVQLSQLVQGSKPSADPE